MSASLFGFALYLLDWDSLRATVNRLSPWSLVAATLIIMAEFPILGYRWHRIVQPFAVLPLRENMRRYMLAAFFNNFTPGQLGSDVYRFFSLRSRTENGATLVALLLQERLIGLVSFMVFYLICLVVLFIVDPAPLTGGWSVWLSAGVVSLAGVVGLASARSLVRVAEQFRVLRDVSPYRTFLAVCRTSSDMRSLSWFSEVMVLSLVGGGAIWTLAVFVVARDAGLGAPFLALGMVSVFADVIRLVPVTIQGIGVREAAFAYLLNLMGYEPELGFVIGTVSYLALSLALVLSGAIGKAIRRQEPG